MSIGFNEGSSVVGRRGRALLAMTAATLLLSACGPAPWTVDTDDPDTGGTTTTPPVTVAPPVPNDLVTGSAERTLKAGPATATINYWSSLSMDRWTPGAVKPVSLSLSTTVKPNDGQKVYLQKTVMLAVPANDTETFPPLAEQADAASVAPGYLVLSPYSYSQTFNVGPVPDEASYVTLNFTYDFLVQTKPKSKEYAKQTATDTLTIAITPQQAEEE